ncbi:MAG TPA: transcriptional repressor [Puia sp.]|uniref:Fur family transcriptional regulator n=1 Tax=Puia sp. TaxID=2045100 RepID=UPI002CF09319|nr:transcriptional repressor [Puia sp.]HVU94712.1 transcriptional repressor [Puia sp.]
MNEDFSAVLRKHRLLITDARMQMLALFNSRSDGLTGADIEGNLARSINRVTIYRNLQVFCKKGIIHCVPTPDPTVVYALCPGKGLRQSPDHVHFICDDCGKSYCLEDIGIPSVKLPKDFTMNQRDLIMRGRCSSCKQRNSPLAKSRKTA